MINREWKRAGILALALSGWFFTCSAAPLSAQDSEEDRVSDRERRGRERRSREGGPGGRGGGLNRRFDEASPDLGQPLPDISAYDSGGRSIRLRSALKGHYSVIVFGCLT